MSFYGCRRIEYLAGIEKLGFKTEIRHGNGRREVTVTVAPDTLQGLMSLLSQFPREEWPHAFWHWETERPVPCATCRGRAVEIRIDVPSKEAP